MGCDNQSEPVLFCHKLTRNQRHSRLGNTAGRNSAGPIEAAYTCKLDSHIATGRSRAARNSVADSPAAHIGAGDIPHSD